MDSASLHGVTGACAVVSEAFHACGMTLPVFVSPNITSVPKDNNQQVFAEYRRRTLR